MNLQLTNKERLLLEDQKTTKRSVSKSTMTMPIRRPTPTESPLKQNAQTEQEHLNTINQLLSGQIPSMNQGQSGTQQQAQSPMQMQQQQSPQQTAQQPTMNFQGQNQSAGYQADQDLCTDMLMTEKYVSGPTIRPSSNFAIPKCASSLTTSKGRTTARRSDLQLYAECGHV